jgi:predicted nuclease of predicted toxin-antitoxin system
VKFLVDAQLPPALALWLREAGHEAYAVRDVGLRNADDEAIWNHALSTGSVIITKDEDFPTRALQVDTSPVIVWLRIGNSTNPILKQRLIPQLPQVLAWIEQGIQVVEIR